MSFAQDGQSEKQKSLQDYLILILTDSNLPTGTSLEQVQELRLLLLLTESFTRRLRCLVWTRIVLRARAAEWQRPSGLSRLS